MKIILFLALSLFSFDANALMSKESQFLSQEVRVTQTKTFNTEVSRNLIHLAHANWNDKAVEGHTTPEFFANYNSGEFLKYIPYGQLMSFEGVYLVNSQSEQTTVRAKAAFELKKVDVMVTYKLINDRYLIDAITINPIEPNNQKLDQVMC